MRTPIYTAVLLAGGQGVRMGKKQPKAFIHVQGQSILDRCLQPFLDHAAIAQIVVVLPNNKPELLEYYQNTLPMDHHKICLVLSGGNTRSQSVWIALQALQKLTHMVIDHSVPDHTFSSTKNQVQNQAQNQTDYVFIHDVARPFVSSELLDRLMVSVLRNNAVIPVIPVRDSLKWIDNQYCVTKQKQQQDGRYALAQTPQVFLYSLLYKAFAGIPESALDFEDEAHILETLHTPVTVVRGDPANIKITYPEDLILLGGS